MNTFSSAWLTPCSVAWFHATPLTLEFVTKTICGSPPMLQAFVYTWRILEEDEQ